MAQGKQAGFLFVECDGPAGRTDPAARRKKNRHAQLSCATLLDDSVVSVRPPEPARIQIRFRATPLVASREGASAAQHDRRSRQACDRDIESDASSALISRGRRRRVSRPKNKSDVTSEQAGDSHAIMKFAATPFSGPPLEPNELRALGYFQTYAAVDLSGYLPGHFWDRLVLQVSHTEPLLRKAIVAVGNAHLDHCTSAVTSDATLNAHAATLHQLRAYLTDTGQPSYELVLACSVLLFALCRMQGDLDAAAAHLSNGMAILNQARKTQRGRLQAQECADTLREVTMMFVQLDIEATMQDIDRGPYLDLSRRDMKPPHGLEDWASYPKPVSPHDAMEAWMYICHDMWAFISTNSHYRFSAIADVPEAVVEGKRNIQARIKAWRLATKSYIKTHPAVVFAASPASTARKLESSQIIDAINALIIQGHYFACKRFIAESLADPTNPRPFDKNPDMLLSTARLVLKLRHQYQQTRNVQMNRTFSIHVGLVEALLLLAHRTTAPTIRAQAQTLIQRLQNVQHGLSGLAAFFAGYGAPPDDFILIYEAPGH